MPRSEYDYLRRLTDADLLGLFEMEDMTMLPIIGEIVRRWCTRVVAIEQTKKWVEIPNVERKEF